MNRPLALGTGALALGFLLLQPVTAMADPPAHARNENSARQRGHVVHHHGHRYYYSRGAWYRPYGPGFVVVNPPVGLVVSFLPEISATLHFGGVPYYQAGPVYYAWDPRLRGYVVIDQPYRRW
jgi:hypothetical protein